jgi:hypothetical protein
MNPGEQQGLGSFLKVEVFLCIFNRKSYQVDSKGAGKLPTM